MTMQTTTLDDAEAPSTDAPVRLRASVYRALAASKGAKTVVACAALHGTNRQNLFKLLSGARSASLDLAMRMAEDLGVPVEVLFERTGRPQRRTRRAAR